MNKKVWGMVLSVVLISLSVGVFIGGYMESEICMKKISHIEWMLVVDYPGILTDWMLDKHPDGKRDFPDPRDCGYTYKGRIESTYVPQPEKCMWTENRGFSAQYGWGDFDE